MRSIVIISITLIVLVAAVYMQTGGHEFLNFDDNDYVTNNPHVVSGITGNNIMWAFTSVDAANWHPITWLSHMADVQFYGTNPRGHHLTNVAIHTVSSLLLLLLLLRLTGSLWPSAFVAAMFALHPLHVESVAWVAERKDVLSAFFWFSTLFLYAEYVAKRRSALYFLALFSFALGLMSKPMLVTLPVVMLMMDYWPLGRYRNEGGVQEPGQRPGSVMALIKEKIPFFACSLCSGIVTVYAQHKGGAMTDLGTMPLYLRIQNALISYVKYIGKTLWPFDLAVLYPIPSSFPLWQTISSLLVLLLLSVAAIRAGRRHPYLPVGWFWFIVTLVPVIGLIRVGGQAMADRYSYIPLTGLFILAAWGVPDLAKGLKHREGVLALLAGTLVIASAALSWHQLGYWRDTVTLFKHTIQVTTDNYLIHNHLGVALGDKGSVDAAIEEFRESLRINPNYSDTHNSMGDALAKKGDLDAAVREYREALHLNPNFSFAHNNLGTALANKGNLDAAIQEFHAALNINPDYLVAHNNLGIALANKGDLDAAIREIREALRINPNFSDAHNTLGTALAGKGDLDAAMREFHEALRINPDFSDAHNNLGIVLAKKGSLDAAIQEYRKALSINPDFSEAHNNLGRALVQRGTQKETQNASSPFSH